jgi:hypothetical protein
MAGRQKEHRTTNAALHRTHNHNTQNNDKEFDNPPFYDVDALNSKAGYLTVAFL